MKKVLISFLACQIVLFCFGKSYAQESFYESYGDEIDMVVAQDGSGDYTTVQAAINAVPNNSSERTVIFIKKGSYYEKVRISSSKINLVLLGEDVDSTRIYYDDYAQSDTEDDSSVEIDANNFLAMNLTFENSYDKHDSQALAVTTNGDKQTFLHCRFIGWQDTYYTRTSKRNYLKDCFIEGCVDYIYGSAIAVFDSCQLHNNRLQGGYITAASTPQGNKFGYVFRNNVITGDAGVHNVEMGRPWREYAKTVFMNTYMNGIMKPGGWNDWGKTEAVYSTVFYAEYNNSGAGFQPDERVDWSHILTDEQAGDYTLQNIFSAGSGASISDNWLPDVDDEPLFKMLKNYVKPFMDSANYNANILKLEYAGNQTLEFDPDMTDYMIELDPSSSVIPEFTVTTENPRATVEIEYPETLPGITTIKVTAYDRSTHTIYTIYNSVNDAYNNAFLDSMYIKNIKVENFNPEVYVYDIVLPKGSSKYFAIAPYKQVEDASYRITKPNQLPGDVIVTVTSYSGEITKVYTFHISVSTGMPENRSPINLQVSYVKGNIHCKTPAICDKSNFEIFDVNGKLLIKQDLPSFEKRINFSLPIYLQQGFYFYTVENATGKASGKFLVR